MKENNNNYETNKSELSLTEPKFIEKLEQEIIAYIFSIKDIDTRNELIVENIDLLLYGTDHEQLRDVLFNKLRGIKDERVKGKVDEFYKQNKGVIVKCFLLNYTLFIDGPDFEKIAEALDSILQKHKCGFSDLQQLIKTDPKIILDEIEIDKAYIITKSLLSEEEFKEYLKENCVTIWKKLNEEDTAYGYTIAIELISKCFVAEDVDFINENIEELLKNTNSYNVAEICKAFIHKNNRNVELKPSLNRYYEMNKRLVVEYILSESSDFFSNSSRVIEKEDMEKYIDTMSQLLDELMEEQNCTFADIEKIGQGSFSMVYGIGEKVLKIGMPRETYHIPNHKRILQPFYRGNFEDNEGVPFACIEISEKVNPKVSPLTDRYQIYKELREAGIKWTDVRSGNLGTLKKANKPTYKGKEFESNPEFNGLKGNVSEKEVLEKRRCCNY